MKANLWLVDVFNSSKSVIQFSDKEAGVIKGKYVMYYKAPQQYIGEITNHATITITARDNEITMSLYCPDRPHMFYPAQTMNNDINKLFSRFKTAF